MSDVGLLLIIPIFTFAFFLYHRRKFIDEKFTRLVLASFLISWPLGMFIVHWTLGWDKQFSSLPVLLTSITLGIIAIYIELKKGR